LVSRRFQGENKASHSGTSTAGEGRRNNHNEEGGGTERNPTLF